MALGADRSSIVAMIFRHTLILAISCLAVGLAFDWIATRVLSKMLYGVRSLYIVSAGAKIPIVPFEGLSIRAISRLTGYDRKTIRRYLASPASRPVYGPRPSAESKLEPFKSYLRERLRAGVTDQDGAHHVLEDSVGVDENEILTYWLELSWTPIQRVLGEWTLENLFETYLHQFRGTKYQVSNQWTLWRIMSHDLHHGGQIAMMLACQDVPAFELRALGGHVVSPPVAQTER